MTPLPRRRARTGWIYLLCFTPRYRHAGHYLGFVPGDDPAALAARIAEHLGGRRDGSPLVKAALAAGCVVEHVRTWGPGETRARERRMKDSGSSCSLCPRCVVGRRERARKSMAGVRARRKAAR